MTLISLEHVTKRYLSGDNELRALDDVSLEVDEGAFVAIMGASGSGKSTLMNVVGCLDRPSSGTCRIEGRDVSRMNADELAELRNRFIGFVFQQFHLLSRTSAIENVELPLLYANVPGPERRRRAQAALARVGLESRMDHLPAQLSGGQQQRVAIARAIVNRPFLLLADEPTGNLDSRTSIEVMALFQELGREGLTVMLVTHEPDVAKFAGRVVVMRDGRIIQDEEQTARHAEPVQGPSIEASP